MNKTKEIFDKYEMTEKRFWQLVGEANWPENGYDRPKLAYLMSLKAKEGKELTAIVSELWNTLDTFIAGRYDGLCVGDDSYSDLLFHIIGLGKEQFYAHLLSYTLIKNRANKGHMSNDGYKESFGYAIPYCGEWDDIPASIKEVQDTMTSREIILAKKAKKSKLGKDKTLITYTNIIENISEVLSEADGKWVAEIYNKICSNEIKYVEDGVWTDA